MSIGSSPSASRMSHFRELVGAEVLVIDQDKKVQRGMTQLLSAANLHVTCAETPEQGLEELDKRFFSVVIVDLDTPAPSAGLSTITVIKEKSPTSMVVLLTPRKSFDDAVEAIRCGAVDIVFKAPKAVPYLKERVLAAAGRSVDTREVNSILVDVKKSHDQFLKLFMDAERRALDNADRVAGRDPNRLSSIDEIRLLLVDSDSSLAETLSRGAPRGYSFHSALSGGQALDICSSDRFHYVMVGENLFDLPSSMVIRSIKTQFPEVVVLAYAGPGPGGKIELVETSKRTLIVPEFRDPQQLLERLDELAEAFCAKARESRYTQAFRERHYDFLRRYVELKMKIERALSGS
jgi:DNA-binding NtrC family response regulator